MYDLLHPLFHTAACTISSHIKPPARLSTSPLISITVGKDRIYTQFIMRPLGKLPPSITNDASALSDYSDRVIRASAAPDCYLDTASAHRDRRISSLEFFKRVVRHLGPKDARVRHPDDDRPLGDFINPLFYKGEFGPVAVAVKLCESDPLAATVDSMLPGFTLPYELPVYG